MWTVILGAAVGLLLVSTRERQMREEQRAWNRELCEFWLEESGRYSARIEALQRELESERAKIAELEAAADPLPLMQEVNDG